MPLNPLPSPSRPKTSGPKSGAMIGRVCPERRVRHDAGEQSEEGLEEGFRIEAGEGEVVDMRPGMAELLQGWQSHARVLPRATNLDGSNVLSARRVCLSDRSPPVRQSSPALFSIWTSQEACQAHSMRSDWIRMPELDEPRTARQGDRYRCFRPQARRSRRAHIVANVQVRV